MQNWILGDDIAEVVEDIDKPTIENTEFYYDVKRGMNFDVFILFSYFQMHGLTFFHFCRA